MKITAFVDVLSHWCLAAQPALDALRATLADDVRLEIALAPVAGEAPMGFTNAQEAWFYTRGTLAYGTELDASWCEGRDTTTWHANAAVAAGVSFGSNPIVLGRRFSRAAMVDGLLLARESEAVRAVSKFTGVDERALLEVMRSDAIVESLRAGNARLAAIGCAERPSWELVNDNGDRAVLQGVWQAEAILPLARVARRRARLPPCRSAAGARGMTRCAWAGSDPAMIAYHDREWGTPVHDDRVLFEFLVLEGAQAGLSWSTILHRRDGYRAAYRGFDPAKVARFGERDVARLLGDERIIRNRAKVAWSIRNAQAFLAVQRERGSFDAYLWSYVGGEPVVNRPRTSADIPARTELSDALSKDLRKRGFGFVGSTICYALMQAVGVVNDHAASCFLAPPAPSKRRKTAATSAA